MRKKVITIAIVTLLTIGIISVALSQGRGHRAGRGRFGPHCGPGMAARGRPEPDLTKEQLEKLQPLRAGFEKETLSLRNELELKSLELRHLWTVDELDEEAIVAKSREVSDLQAQLQEKMIRHRLDVAKILTKEQRARFLAGSTRGLGPEPRGRGRGGRPGMGTEKGRGRGFGPPRRGW